MRQDAVPVPVRDPLNCTNTESLVPTLLSAFIRTQRWYGLPASTLNVFSK